mgnify:FL=1
MGIVGSHPVWDEWIEITNVSGEAATTMSHPVWDEWIEIGGAKMRISKEKQSHPVWDEWIEIFVTSVGLLIIAVSSRLG